jgi:hypothetical protein
MKSPSIVYWLRGAEHVAMAELSAESVRRVYPDARIYGYTDQPEVTPAMKGVTAWLTDARQGRPAMVANLEEDTASCPRRRVETRERLGNGNGFGTPIAVAARLADEESTTKRSREERLATGALNPEFSGWLMGAYPGWTLPDGPPLPRTINGWDGGEAGLVYYRGRPAPKGMPLLTTDKTHRRQRLKAHGNGVVPAQAVMAWSVLAGSWLPQR